MNPNLKIFYKTLFFRYKAVTKVLQLHLIDFFTVQAIHKKGLNSIRYTDANILDLNNAKLTKIFFKQSFFSPALIECGKFDRISKTQKFLTSLVKPI